MTPALLWVLLFIGVLITFPAGWRTGYQAGTRRGIRRAADEFECLADEAIELANSGVLPPTAPQIEAAIRRHPSNVRYLRDRRDKIT